MASSWQRRSIGLVLAAIASIVPPHECAAQGGGPVAVGYRMRVPIGAASDGYLTGTIVAASAVSVTLRLAGSPPRSATLAMGDLRSAQISTGRRRGAWGLRGAVVGGVVGAIALVAALHSGSSEVPEFDSVIETAATPGVALAGFVGGGLIGLSVGALSAPERWEPVYIPSAIAPRPSP
jgi:hypothetical protein